MNRCCTRCKIEKPEKELSGPYCRSCWKKHYSYANNITTRIKSKERRKKDAEKNKEYFKEWRKKNPKYHNSWSKEKKKTDGLFRLRCNLRSALSRCLTNKSLSTEEILGCSLQEFKEHLESQFEPWMSWNNYGGQSQEIKEQNVRWDVDHIIPLSSATTKEELYKLNHFSNLRPCCSYLNRWVKRAS
jgi:hypothetical protein